MNRYQPPRHLSDGPPRLWHEPVVCHVCRIIAWTVAALLFGVVVALASMGAAPASEPNRDRIGLLALGALLAIPVLVGLLMTAVRRGRRDD